MTPTEFKDDIVIPNMEAMKASVGDMRLAYNCVFTLDALVAQIFYWDKKQPVSKITATKHRTDRSADDSYYRNELSKSHTEFALLHDLAKTMKHCKLSRGQPKIRNSSDIESKPIGVLGTGYWNDNAIWHDDARWNNGPNPLPQVVVDSGNGVYRSIEAIADAALQILEAEIANL